MMHTHNAASQTHIEPLDEQEQDNRGSEDNLPNINYFLQNSQAIWKVGKEDSLVKSSL